MGHITISAPRCVLARFTKRCCMVVTAIAFVAACAAHGLEGQGAEAEKFCEYVDAKGNIALPADYETTFIHIGTVAVAPKSGEAVNEMHGTYTRLKDLEAFRRDGKFPDGAVLVKDVRASAGAKLTTGEASFGTNVKVWFVMIKDSNGRFPDNELWGDGWGWALFEGKDRSKQVAVNYRTECRSCHVPVKKQDWIYTQCYPSLSAKTKVAVSETKSEGTDGKPDLLAMFPHWKDATLLKGDAKAGRDYYGKKSVGNAMTCSTCHSFDARDTMKADGDGLVRAGFPIYAASHRTNIKNSGTSLASLGGNVCVLHFMGGKAAGMNATELSNLEAFLRSGGSKEHPTAANIDYKNAKWTIPEKLTGGNADRGAKLAMQTCITCHKVGEFPARLVEAGSPLKAGSYPATELKELALQIRNPDYKHNQEMPGYKDLRMSNEQLLDLLAWFAKR